MTPYFAIPENKSRYEKILRSWIGTPYRHATVLKGRAADCVLFVAATLVELGVLPQLPNMGYYWRDWPVHGREEFLLKSIDTYRKDLIDGLFLERFEADEKEVIWGDWMIFKMFTKFSNHSVVYLDDNQILHAVVNDKVRIEQYSKGYRNRHTYTYRLHLK